MTPEQEREVLERTPAFVDVLHLYPDPGQAFSAYVRYLEEKFGHEDGSPQCVGCGTEHDVVIHEIAWRGDYASNRSNWKNLLSLPLAFVGHGLTHHETIRFRTYHPLCRRCRRDVRWRGYGSDLARIGLFVATLLVGIVATMSFCVFALPYGFDRVWHWKPFVVFITSAIAFVVVYRFARRGAALWLPRFLAPVAKKYFFIERVTALS